MQKLGSWKNKVVAPEMKEERDKCNFDQNEMSELLYGGKEWLDTVKGWNKDFDSDQILRNSEKWYEMTRAEQLEINMAKMKQLYLTNKEKYYHKLGLVYFYPQNFFQGLVIFFELCNICKF